MLKFLLTLIVKSVSIDFGQPLYFYWFPGTFFWNGTEEAESKPSPVNGHYILGGMMHF